MRKIIEVPFIGVNDTQCQVNSLEIAAGELIKKGTTICVLETTKTTIEVEAEHDGHYYLIPAIGETVNVGQPLFLFSTEKETGDIKETAKTLTGTHAAADSTPFESRFTKKAQILLEKHQLSADIFQHGHSNDKKITESDVLNYIERNRKNNKRKGIKDLERVAIIGGASGGGALILIDSLLLTRDKIPVCIFDKDENFHGQKVLGVPIVGSIDLLYDYLDEGKIDSVVIAFNRNLAERTRVFEEVKAKGARFTNIIDPNAEIRSGVTIGIGNVILSNTYIGSCSEIGDNNFISANVFIEHGNILGNGNAFGPGVFTSGNVTIGSGIRFGTGIFVEPNISIGDNAVIASGAVLTKNIDKDTVVRVTENLQFKPLH